MRQEPSTGSGGGEAHRPGAWRSVRIWARTARRSAWPRLRQDLLGILRYHRSGLFVLAVLVGLTAGGGAVLFRLGIDAWTSLLTGAQDYTRSLGPSVGLLSPAGTWFVLLAPLVSGLLVGPVMALAGRTPTGHGVGGVIWSARRGDGTMAPLPALASTVSATLTIGGGGSVGPEGPIAELGASAAALFGRRLGLPVRWLRLLAASGTAAGIAAAFNAPLAGAFFALEVVLADFTVDAFAFVVLSCVSATVLSHHLLGTTLSLSLPVLNLGGDTELGWVGLLGVAGGVVGVLFSRCRFLLADAAARLLARVPVWLRPGVGGLGVGLFLLLVPEVYGESSAVLDRALDNRYTVLMLVGLTAAKVLATSLTLGVGFVGGVFAPSLFVGGTLGAAFGTAVMPGLPAAPTVFGVIGMGAVFAGAARAPITGVILIIEMTSQYRLLLPLMLAVVLATTTSRFLTRTTIYTEELRRRGEDVDDPVRGTVVGRRTAGDLMQDPPALLTPAMSLRQAANVLRSSGSSVLPLVDPDEGGHGRLRGCVSAVAVAEAVLSRSPEEPVGDLEVVTDHLDVHDGATAVLGALVRTRADGLPVTRRRDDGSSELVGWVDQEEMVRRLYRHQHAALEAAQTRTSLGARTQTWWRARRARR